MTLAVEGASEAALQEGGELSDEGKLAFLEERVGEALAGGASASAAAKAVAAEVPWAKRNQVYEVAMSLSKRGR